MMFRQARTVTAALVALAINVAPIALDHCAESCEAQHKPAAASAPSCHHAAPVAVHVGRVPVPCGHDHHVTVATAATIAAIGVSRAPIALIAFARTPLVSLSADYRLAGESPPDFASTFQRQPLPFRV